MVADRLQAKKDKRRAGVGMEGSPAQALVG